MTQNDFFVAIQSIMTQEYDDSESIERVYQWAQDAIDEWLGEMDPEFDEEEE